MRHQRRNLIKLKVSNFDPSAESDIELRPMSVFDGSQQYRQILPSDPNLRTSSVLRWLFVDRGNRKMHGGFYSLGLPLINPIGAKMALSDTDIDHIYAWAATERMKIESASRTGAVPSDSDLPVEVCEIIRRALGEVSYLNDVLKEELVRCFGSKRLMVRYSPNNAKAYPMHAVLSNEPSDGDAYRYEIGNREEASIDPTMRTLFSSL